MSTIALLQKFLPVNKGHYAALESLRGIAAMMVVVHHYANWVLGRTVEGSVAHGFQMLTKHWGGLGVQLFFVISGFLIPSILAGRKTPYFQYLWRRVRRIYPLAIIAILLACAVRVVNGKPVINDPITGNQWLDVLLNLLLVPGVFPMERLYEVTWTLSYEMLFYATCPFVLAGLCKISQNPMIRILILLLVIPLIRTLSPYHDSICYFIVGYISFELCRSFSDNARLSAYLNIGALTFAPFVILAYMVNASGWQPRMGTGEIGFYLWLLFLGLAFLCLVGAATAFKGRLAALISGPLFSLVGAISYSLYLLHVLVIGFIFAISDHFLPSGSMGNATYFGLLTLTLIISLVAAFFGYILVERPLSLDGKWPWHVRRIS
jgi:exopolysaccharide production protein ExoZ